MEGALVSNPLERNLGFYDFGRYTKAPGDADFAFEKVNDLWNEEIHAELNSDDEAAEDSMEDNDSELDQITDSIDGEKKNLTNQERKELKRKQETTSPQTLTKRMKTEDETEKVPEQFLRELWNDMQESTDKLFLIKRHEENKRHSKAEWHLVQIDLDETNNRQARKIGEYHVRYYVRQFDDAKKKLVRNCRYWPLIREIKPDGYFGDIIVLRPSKVEETLRKKPYTRGWYQGKVNLADNGLVGPFNFATKQGSSHLIPKAIWTALEDLEEVKDGLIDIRDINQMHPLH
jgi:hypothetical protein